MRAAKTKRNLDLYFLKFISNSFLCELCVWQFNIIYFINYTHIVGELAIKIFAMEENMYMGTAARQASVPTD